MQIHGKNRREHRRRNCVAKELHDPKYSPKVVQSKRRRRLEEIHELESDEDLDSYLGEEFDEE